VNFFHEIENLFITWEHFHSPKLGFQSNESKTYVRIWADFFWNFGLVRSVYERPVGLPVKIFLAETHTLTGREVIAYQVKKVAQDGVGVAEV
jgi:hypothetical protein